MARTSTYLNLAGNTEQAFQFYKAAFQTEFGGAIHRMGDAPPAPGAPELSELENDKILHIEPPITRHPRRSRASVRGAQRWRQGTNAPDGHVLGRLRASFVDQFGVQWMLNCLEPKG